MNTKRTRIAIHGAAGRMGQRLIALSADDPQLQLVAAIEAAGHPRAGEDSGVIAGGSANSVPLTAELPGGVDVVIDFSVPEAATRIARECGQRETALVLATTGMDEVQHAEILKLAERIPLLWAPNMSLAVNIAMKLSQIAATALKEHAADVDVEIIERHHRHKEDAPSGTALRFGELIAAEMGQTAHQHGRSGRPGPRSPREIGYHAVRVGDNPGQHTIVFGMPGESLELHVAATNRDSYALGALAAARFLDGKPAGSYTMNDVLDL